MQAKRRANVGDEAYEKKYMKSLECELLV